jgi:hypothetical protein
VAEDIRRDDPADGDLTLAKAALVDECAREEENALYTSTIFFIWLRFLKAMRAMLWAGAALGSALAASHILRGNPNMKHTLSWAFRARTGRRRSRHRRFNRSPRGSSTKKARPRSGQECSSSGKARTVFASSYP